MAELYRRRADELGVESPVPYDQLALMTFAMANGFALERLLEPESVPDELHASMLGIFFVGRADDDRAAVGRSCGQRRRGRPAELRMSASPAAHEPGAMEAAAIRAYSRTTAALSPLQRWSAVRRLQTLLCHRPARRALSPGRRHAGSSAASVRGPLLLLTTTGRRSGQRRTTPVIFVPGDRPGGDRLQRRQSPPRRSGT